MSYTYNQELLNWTFQAEQKNNRRKTFSILIVDDDIMNGNNLKTILSKRGHNVSFVDDGPECIIASQENMYDMMFIDYHMKGIDGAQVADIVKNNKTILFAYTGDNSKKALEDFKNVGMNGVLIKPFDMDAIDMLMNKMETATIINKNDINLLSRKSGRSVIIFDELRC